MNNNKAIDTFKKKGLNAYMQDGNIHIDMGMEDQSTGNAIRIKLMSSAKCIGGANKLNDLNEQNTQHAHKNKDSQQQNLSINHNNLKSDKMDTREVIQKLREKNFGTNPLEAGLGDYSDHLMKLASKTSNGAKFQGMHASAGNNPLSVAGLNGKIPKELFIPWQEIDKVIDPANRQRSVLGTIKEVNPTLYTVIFQSTFGKLPTGYDKSNIDETLKRKYEDALKDYIKAELGKLTFDEIERLGATKKLQELDPATYRQKFYSKFGKYPADPVNLR